MPSVSSKADGTPLLSQHYTSSRCKSRQEIIKGPHGWDNIGLSCCFFRVASIMTSYN